jgi:hypothetical protein
VADAPRSVSVENMMIGMVCRARRNARTASMPFISGISMSIVTRSGASWSTFASAMRPLDAKPTTSMSGSRESESVTSRRMTTESSTTSTRILVTGPSSLTRRPAAPAGSSCPSVGAAGS